MRTKSNNSRKNFKITVIFRDEVITERFSSQSVAISTINGMKTLFPEVFMSGAVEERRKKWEVVWVLGNDCSF